MTSTWGPRLVKVGAALAVLGVLAWAFGTSPTECREGDRLNGCGLSFVGVLAVLLAPGAIVAGIGGLLVKRGYDREVRARERSSVDVTLRRATAADADAVADLLIAARRAAAGAIPPAVHSDDEVRAWVVARVVPELEAWVAEAGPGDLAGVLILDGASLEQLYVDPARTGRGVGTALLDLAKRERPAGLRLWTFAANVGARRFYERRGFVATDRTDGDNEEGAPDIRYAWRRPD